MTPRRSPAPAPRGLFVRLLAISVSYWDADAFLAWNVERYGRTWKRKAERDLALSRRALGYLSRGERAPTLDTYARLVARAGVPLGTWLRGLEVPAESEQVSPPARP